VSFKRFVNLDECGTGTPLISIPQEVIKYYEEHGYLEKGIPLSADTCNEIYEKLHGKNIGDGKRSV
jgi:hypothetical protein